MRDYYEILGVGREATADELKSAYRRLARQHHPDANQGDPEAAERFKELSEAYSVLSDPQKRAHYDHYGNAGGNGAGGGADMGFNFEDIFDVFFGGPGGPGGQAGGDRRAVPGRGRDFQVDLEITLEEAFRGVEKEIPVNGLAVCVTCGGNGLQPGKKAATCRHCKGAGQIQVIQSTLFGRFVSLRPCDHCGGSGTLIEDPCPNCRGEGRKVQSRRVQVKIPPGASEGVRFRLSGEGEAGRRGGSPGDLYVRLREKRHQVFEREGDDLYSELAMPFTQAALGAEVEVDTIEGKTKLHIPPGTQNGAVFHLKGKGMPRFRAGGRGDQVLRATVRVPTELTPEEKALLHQLARLRGETVTEDKGFFQKVKDAFGV